VQNQSNRESQSHFAILVFRFGFVFGFHFGFSFESHGIVVAAVATFCVENQSAIAQFRWGRGWLGNV